MLRTLFLLSCLALTVYSDCALYNPSGGPPQNATGDQRTPRDYSKEWKDPPACPDFYGVDSCCTDYANSAAYYNYQKIRTAFGNAAAGCDICAANIERFFCYYSCHPQQDKFVTFIGYDIITIWNDTSNTEVDMNVTVVNITYNANQACQLFQSCSKIAFLTEISAGGSAQGFFTFLFDRGILESYTKVNVAVVNEGGLFFDPPPHRCNETFPDGYDDLGYQIPGNCSCNFCQDSCEPLQFVPYGNITDGFNSSSVVMGYLFAILLTVGVTFYNVFKKQRSQNQSSSYSQRTLLHNDSTSR